METICILLIFAANNSTNENTKEGSTPPELTVLQPLSERYISELFEADRFPGIDTEICILFVPFGSMSEYMNADGWKDFKNIVEYDPNQGPIVIETVSELTSATMQLFDLQGRRLNNTSRHSIFIENGKKRIQR